MRVLLLGEYSNVHATLADGLRALGCSVDVASDGNGWKNYPRNIDLARGKGRFAGIVLMCKILWNMRKWRNYDVVQLINPVFLEIKAERILPIYRYLRRHNRKVILDAFGMDYYWIHENLTRKPLRYSDFNFGSVIRKGKDAQLHYNEWIDKPKGLLNREIALSCDKIVAGLYEYLVTYSPLFRDKTVFIPFPIRLPDSLPCIPDVHEGPVKFFIGIDRERSAYKGTDIMLAALMQAKADYPDKITVIKVENVPFAEYQRLVEGSDAILDQLYSYTPSMNPLMAMSKGVICIGGGEPENYEILGDTDLFPIINVLPDFNSVYAAVRDLALHPERIPQLKRQSIEYVRRYHDYVKVARQYLDLYRS